MDRVDKLRVVCEFLFLLLLGGLFYLQIARGDYYYSLSNKNCIRVVPSSGLRGRILDCSGGLVAGNELSYNISILPQEFQQNKETLLKLSSLLKISSDELSRIISKSFVSGFSPIVIETDADKRTAVLIEENKFLLPGVIVQAIAVRSYPYGNLASHLIGYLSEIEQSRLTKLKNYGYKIKDMVGFGGVEQSADKFLRAQDGGIQLQVDRRARPVRVLGYKAPCDGRDVCLTIDIRIQKIAEEVLVDTKGAVVLMEPYTGMIIAMASSPNFYPQAFQRQDGLDYVREVLKDGQAPMVNRAISGQYPAGSIFKIVSTVAALQERKVKEDRKFYCSGRLLIGLSEFACRQAHGAQNLKEAIANSCNIYFYHLALLLGPDILTRYAMKFGLGRPSGIDLPFEAGGSVPSVLGRRMKLKEWYDGDTANFGIGQGDLLVTPLQAVRLIAAIANGGRLVRPFVIKSVAGEPFSRQQSLGLGLAASVLESIKRGLREVVTSEGATAHALYFENLQIAGKTGTAEVDNKLSHGWFVGFAPYDKPRIAICVFLENCGGSGYAVMAARHIFKRMMEEGLI